MELTEHHHGATTTSPPGRVLKSIRADLKSIRLGNRYTAPDVREEIRERLLKRGWSSVVRVSPLSKMTISARMGRVGLCIQTGNISRYYADLLKLQTLYLDKSIDSGILVVPTKRESRKLGANLANFSRITEELKVFNKSISVPLTIIGFERGR